MLKKEKMYQLPGKEVSTHFTESILYYVGFFSCRRYGYPFRIHSGIPADMPGSPQLGEYSNIVPWYQYHDPGHSMFYMQHDPGYTTLYKYKSIDE